MSVVAVSSGARVDLQTPEPSTIRMADIARGLGGQCRYNGHTCRAYTIAEHCLVGAALTDDPMVKLGFLLHDAAEAYMGDIAGPLRAILPALDDIEQGLQQAIRGALQVPGQVPTFDHPDVKDIDRVMLYAEVAELMPNGGFNLPPWPEAGGLIALARYRIAEQQWATSPDLSWALATGLAIVRARQ